MSHRLMARRGPGAAARPALAGAVALVLLCAAPPVLATRAAGARPPTPEAVRAVREVAPLAQADDSSGLREGTVAGLSPHNHWVYVNGRWLGIVEGRTRLFQQGRPVGRAVLARGQRLRFNLASGENDGSILGVVYVP